MKNSILRDNLNKHITNNVIIRIDYIPITDDKVDLINSLLAKNFLVDNKLFSNNKQTFIRKFDVNLNDSSIQDINDFVNIEEKSRIKSYEYYKIDENSNIEMKLIFNRQFTSISVDQNIRYYNYEIYRDIFLQILDILSENNTIINRFGLRKFNEFFIKSDISIDKYVKDRYFNLDCDDLIKDSESYISEKKYNFSKKEHNVNLTTHSSIGKFDDNLAKRIAFDIDVYITDLNYLEKLFNKDNKYYIDKVNDLLFSVYINILSDNMLKLLNKSSELDDEDIIYGVEYNENI